MDLGDPVLRTDTVGSLSSFTLGPKSLFLQVAQADGPDLESACRGRLQIPS